MDNSFVYKQGQVFINNRPHNIVFPIRRNTVNTSDFIVFSIKQCLGLSHTNRYVEKVQLTYQCVSVQDLQQGEVCELVGWSQWHGAGAAGLGGRVSEHQAKTFAPPPPPPPPPPLPRDMTTEKINEYEQTHNQQHV